VVIFTAQPIILRKRTWTPTEHETCRPYSQSEWSGEEKNLSHAHISTLHHSAHILGATLPTLSLHPSFSSKHLKSNKVTVSFTCKDTF
jgi:hypothetical protein